LAAVSPDNDFVNWQELFFNTMFAIKPLIGGVSQRKKQPKRQNLNIIPIKK